MKDVINKGDDPVSPAGNGLGGLDVGPTTDSAQLDMKGLVKKANDVEEAVTDHDNNKGDDGTTLHNAVEVNDKSNVVEPSLAVPLNGNHSKEMITEGEDPVSPLPKDCSEGVDVGPTTDSAQLDMNELVKKDVELDETDTVQVCDLVVGADLKADQANGGVETVSEIASKADPPKNSAEIVSEIGSKADPGNNSVEIVSEIASTADPANDSEETVSDIASEADPINNNVEICSESASKADPASNSDKTLPGITLKADPTNNGVKTVPEIASEADPFSNSDKTVPGFASKVDPAIIHEAILETASEKPVASPVNVSVPANIEKEEDNAKDDGILSQNGTLHDKECAKGDVDGDHKVDGEVASVELGLDCNTETPPSKLKPDSENDIAKNADEVNAPMGIDLNSTSTEGGTVEEVQENNTNEVGKSNF